MRKTWPPRAPGQQVSFQESYQGEHARQSAAQHQVLVTFSRSAYVGPCPGPVCLPCPAGSPPTPRRGVHFAAEAAAPRAAAAAGGGGAHGLLSRALRPTVLAARQRSLHNLLDLGVSASAELAIAAVDAQVLPTGLYLMTYITAGFANAELGLEWA
jgi:hypothetical protein